MLRRCQVKIVIVNSPNKFVLFGVCEKKWFSEKRRLHRLLSLRFKYLMYSDLLVCFLVFCNGSEEVEREFANPTF